MNFGWRTPTLVFYFEICSLQEAAANAHSANTQAVCRHFERVLLQSPPGVQGLKSLNQRATNQIPGSGREFWFFVFCRRGSSHLNLKRQSRRSYGGGEGEKQSSLNSCSAFLRGAACLMFDTEKECRTLYGLVKDKKKKRKTQSLAFIIYGSCHRFMANIFA